jgi:hypothetical protein
MSTHAAQRVRCCFAAAQTKQQQRAATPLKHTSVPAKRSSNNNASAIFDAYNALF